ncbi:hypothetical protein [Acinetobacter equi]|uniref:Lipoprotein n=1 Tax=Acinetobacter equi TaxID=1324350 RepID=A0A0N9VFY4_9GAMM|nr:hypothetical protein [Acinetobacter equi]ALH96489.1 hypothetical protein AOY20_13575 [Acinetobacter equi]
MKKITLLLSALILTACATGTNNSSSSQIGQIAFKKAVNAKCSAELDTYDVWRVGTKLMTKSQQKAVEKEVCSCVTQKAPYNAANAVVNSNSYNAMVANAVAGTINSCLIQSFK